MQILYRGYSVPLPLTLFIDSSSVLLESRQSHKMVTQSVSCLPAITIKRQAIIISYPPFPVFFLILVMKEAQEQKGCCCKRVRMLGTVSLRAIIQVGEEENWNTNLLIKNKAGRHKTLRGSEYYYLDGKGGRGVKKLFG